MRHNWPKRKCCRLRARAAAELLVVYARGVARGAAPFRDAAAGGRMGGEASSMGGEASSDGRTAGAAAALSYGVLLAAVGCSLLVGAAAGGGAVHWAELRRRAAYARASSSDGGCADYRAF